MNADTMTGLLLRGHVAISLVGIIAGLICIVAMAGSRHRPRWVAVFLVTTMLTCISGFPLPPYGWDAARIIGIVTIAAAVAAGAGLYLYDLAGVWRPVYVIGFTTALYLNAFVAITQTFLKFEPLRAVAPTQSEWPFVVSHAVGLLAFILLGARAYLAFRRSGRIHAAT